MGGLTGKASGEVAVTRVIGSFEEGTSSRRLWVSRQMLPAEQKRCLALSLVSGDVVRAGTQESATSLTK